MKKYVFQNVFAFAFSQALSSTKTYFQNYTVCSYDITTLSQTVHRQFYTYKCRKLLKNALHEEVFFFLHLLCQPKKCGIKDFSHNLFQNIILFFICFLKPLSSSIDLPAMNLLQAESAPVSGAIKGTTELDLRMP